MAFSYSSETQEGCIVFILKGRFLESHSDHGLMAEVEGILESSTSDFIIELGGMEYLNSTGINLLVRLVKEINHGGQKLIFVNVPKRIYELLEVIKLNSVFTILDTKEDGVRALKA